MTFLEYPVGPGSALCDGPDWSPRVGRDRFPV